MHLPKYVSLYSNRAKYLWLELVEPVEESLNSKKEFIQRHPRGRGEILVGRKRKYSSKDYNMDRSILLHVNICINTLFDYYKNILVCLDKFQQYLPRRVNQKHGM